MNNKVTFPELVEQVAQYANTSKRMSELFLKELFATISQSLIDGESVKVKGIGTFKLTEVSPRKSVDVNTGEEIEIPGHKKLSFAPDKDMAEAINQPFMHFETEILDDDVTDDQLAAIDAGVPTEAPTEAAPAEEETTDDTAAAEAPAAESPVATEEEVVMPPVFVAPVEEPEPEEAEEAEAEAPVEPSEEVPAEEETPAEVPAQEPTDEPEEAVSEEESEIEEEAEPVAVAEPEDEAEVAETEGEPEAEGEMVSEELADERVGQEIDKRRITRRSLLEGFVVGVVTTLIVTLFAYRLYLMKGYEATPADEEPFTEHVATDSVATPEQVLAENSTEADADKQKAAEEQKKADEEKKKAEEESKKAEEEKQKAEEESKKAEEEKQKAEAAKPTTANVAAGTTDTIKPGTNLYRMSRKHYGSDKFWVYIYEENKAKYPNPNTIPVGAVLHIPQLEKYGAKAGDPASIATAKKKQGEIFNHLNKKK